MFVHLEKWPQTQAIICRNMGICDVCREVASMENVPRAPIQYKDDILPV